eukprot:g14164.t1
MQVRPMIAVGTASEADKHPGQAEVCAVLTSLEFDEDAPFGRYIVNACDVQDTSYHFFCLRFRNPLLQNCHQLHKQSLRNDMFLARVGVMALLCGPLWLLHLPLPSQSLPALFHVSFWSWLLLYELPLLCITFLSFTFLFISLLYLSLHLFVFPQVSFWSWLLLYELPLLCSMFVFLLHKRHPTVKQYDSCCFWLEQGGLIGCALTVAFLLLARGSGEPAVTACPFPIPDSQRFFTATACNYGAAAGLVPFIETVILLVIPFSFATFFSLARPTLLLLLLIVYGALGATVLSLALQSGVQPENIGLYVVSLTSLLPILSYESQLAANFMHVVAKTRVVLHLYNHSLGLKRHAKYNQAIWQQEQKQQWEEAVQRAQQMMVDDIFNDLNPGRARASSLSSVGTLSRVGARSQNGSSGSDPQQQLSRVAEKSKKTEKSKKAEKTEKATQNAAKMADTPALEVLPLNGTTAQNGNVGAVVVQYLIPPTRRTDDCVSLSSSKASLGPQAQKHLSLSHSTEYRAIEKAKKAAEGSHALPRSRSTSSVTGCKNKRHAVRVDGEKEALTHNRAKEAKEAKEAGSELPIEVTPQSLLRKVQDEYYGDDTVRRGDDSGLQPKPRWSAGSLEDSNPNRASRLASPLSQHVAAVQNYRSRPEKTKSGESLLCNVEKDGSRPLKWQSDLRSDIRVQRQDSPDLIVSPRLSAGFSSERKKPSKSRQSDLRSDIQILESPELLQRSTSGNVAWCIERQDSPQLSDTWPSCKNFTLPMGRHAQPRSPKLLRWSELRTSDSPQLWRQSIQTQTKSPQLPRSVQTETKSPQSHVQRAEVRIKIQDPSPEHVLRRCTSEVFGKETRAVGKAERSAEAGAVCLQIPEGRLGQSNSSVLMDEVNRGSLPGLMPDLMISTSLGQSLSTLSTEAELDEVQKIKAQLVAAAAAKQATT